MSAKLTSCGVCGASRIRPGHRAFNYDWKRKYLVIIENVPMQICEACGEGFLDSSVSRQLDMIAQPIVLRYRGKRRLRRPLAVVDYRALCAEPQPVRVP